MKTKVAAQLTFDSYRGIVMYVPEQWIEEGDQPTKKPTRMTIDFLEALAFKIDATDGVRNAVERLIEHAKGTELVWREALAAIQEQAERYGFDMSYDEDSGEIELTRGW